MYTCVLHGMKECVIRVQLRESDYLYNTIQYNTKLYFTQIT